MERLTSYKNECEREMICRHEDCMVNEEHCPHMNEDNCPCLQDVLSTLAKYEDLEDRLNKQFNGCIGMGAFVDSIIEYDKQFEKDEELAEAMMITNDEVCKFREWKSLDEQGKLLKLPCKVGDTVWYISDRTEKQGRKKVSVEFVDKGIVDQIIFGDLMIPQITVCNDENIWTTFDAVEDFGTIAFLTQQEAEAALKNGKEQESGVKE